jgi:hypothetical protein
MTTGTGGRILFLLFAAPKASPRLTKPDGEPETGNRPVCWIWYRSHGFFDARREYSNTCPLCETRTWDRGHWDMEGA